MPIGRGGGTDGGILGGGILLEGMECLWGRYGWEGAAAGWKGPGDSLG
jgi:hypothetical protein